MKIRSITCFVNPERNQAEAFHLAGEFFAAAQRAFEEAGYEVQTARLATTPFPEWVKDWQPETLRRTVQQLEDTAGSAGFAYLSLGPALPEFPESYPAIPDMLAATQNTFFGGMMTTGGGAISLPAVHDCADIIHRAASIPSGAFANLRFAALAGIAPGTPFFPSAYHRGDLPAFSLGCEAADLAVTAFEAAASLEEARSNLVSSLDEHAARLTQISEELEREHGVAFGGIDLSPAPFPEPARSIGTALEALGVHVLGNHGSLAAAAFLMDALDRADYKKIGFNGLFQPILEDAVLAQRSAEGSLTVKDLLLYSAVCGCGLDTVPLPGDTSAGQIAALLLDVAAMSRRLNKPLTARLMPVPGKKAGNPVHFDFPYFADSRVMEIEAQPLVGLLAGEESFELKARSNKR